MCHSLSSTTVKMPNRQTYKKTKTNLLDEELEILEDELWDEDIQEIRHDKWVEAAIAEAEREAEKAARRWEQYFFYDGTCRAHDWASCRECSHYARGRCPSYWEERYY